MFLLLHIALRRHLIKVVVWNFSLILTSSLIYSGHFLFWSILGIQSRKNQWRPHDQQISDVYTINLQTIRKRGMLGLWIFFIVEILISYLLLSYWMYFWVSEKNMTISIFLIHGEVKAQVFILPESALLKVSQLTWFTSYFQ